MENIDKMDIGAVSVLNNFLQDLKQGSLFVNGQEYRMTQYGMILLVAREEVSWSPAENSRPVYLRIENHQSELAKITERVKTFL